MRKVNASKETKVALLEAQKTHHTVVSWRPYDKPGCDCTPFVVAEAEQASAQARKAKHLVCPRMVPGMKQYHVVCKQCKAVVGTVKSTDKKLSNWCDFHYICTTDGEKWLGCMTVNISSIDQRIGIECACGADTRDFRPNHSMPEAEKSRREAKSSKGRDFGKKSSAFKLQLPKP